VELHGSISYGDGAAARCWKNAFHAFGSAHFFLGEDQDTPHGLHNVGTRRVGLRPTWYRLPPKPKILATPLISVSFRFYFNLFDSVRLLLFRRRLSERVGVFGQRRLLRVLRSFHRRPELRPLRCDPRVRSSRRTAAADSILAQLHPGSYFAHRTRRHVPHPPLSIRSNDLIRRMLKRRKNTACGYLDVSVLLT